MKKVNIFPKILDMSKRVDVDYNCVWHRTCGRLPYKWINDYEYTLMGIQQIYDLMLMTMRDYNIYNPPKKMKVTGI